MSARYRLWQVWQALAGRPLSESARQRITDHLSKSELTLFRRFGSADRRHSYRVMQSLAAAGHTEEALLAAALLHDVGKTKIPAPLWARSLAVLGEKFAPRRAAAWSREERSDWRRAFVIKEQHPTWGAVMAAEAGSDPLTVNLIRRHQETPPEPALDREDSLLLLLQEADCRN